jgi:hypothetical protein
MRKGSIGTTADNPLPVSQGGIVLANSLTRACLLGNSHGVAVTVVSLVDQTGPGNTGAAKSTLTAFVTANAAHLKARFGLSGALAYLDGLDRSAQFDAIVSGQT